MSEQKEIKQITNPADKKKIRSAFNDISDCLYRIGAEKDTIKEIIKTISEEFDMPKKLVSKMARTFHKESYDSEVKEADDFELCYESIMGSPENE